MQIKTNFLILTDLWKLNLSYLFSFSQWGRIVLSIFAVIVLVFCCLVPCICALGVWFAGWFGLRNRDKPVNNGPYMQPPVIPQCSPLFFTVLTLPYFWKKINRYHPDVIAFGWKIYLLNTQFQFSICPFVYEKSAFLHSSKNQISNVPEKSWPVIDFFMVPGPT